MKNESTNFFGNQRFVKDDYDKEYDVGKMKKIRKREIREKPDFQKAYETKIGAN